MGLKWRAEKALLSSQRLQKSKLSYFISIGKKLAIIYIVVFYENSSIIQRYDRK
jgi:hypothetical protein